MTKRFLEIGTIVMCSLVILGIINKRSKSISIRDRYWITRSNLQDIRMQLEGLVGSLPPSGFDNLRNRLIQDHLTQFPGRTRTEVENGLKMLLGDGWGRPLRYKAPGLMGRPFELYSVGPDGIDQLGGADDLSCWSIPSDPDAWFR